jgi:hypothetical protein
MKTSEQINDLCTALSKAQGIMAVAKFDSVNPFFSDAKAGKIAKYASLAQVWEVARKPLTDNGLSVIQPVEEHEHGIMVTTRLLHVSGQWIESSITMPLDKRTSQAVGSAISYGRRYSLAAMVGVVADDDDDANEATANAPKEDAKRPAKAKADQIAAEHGMNTADQLVLTDAETAYCADVSQQIASAVSDKNEAVMETIAAFLKDKSEPVRKKLAPVWIAGIKVINPTWKKKEQAQAA